MGRVDELHCAKTLATGALPELVLALLSAGDGGSSASKQSGLTAPAAPEGGSITVDTATGIVSDESDAVELQPDLLFSRMAVLTAINPSESGLGNRATRGIKFKNTRTHRSERVTSPRSPNVLPNM
jgi:hypothetical protein